MTRHEEDLLEDLDKKHVEVFKVSADEIEEHGWKHKDGWLMPAGYYAWIAFPGCLPDTEPLYLGRRRGEAIREAHEHFCEEYA